MKIAFPDAENLPIYQHIVNYYIQSIKSGKFQAGYKLPTVRELAKANSLSHGTVKHAYDLLEQQGYIEKSQGRGSFVSEITEPGQHSKKELAIEAIDNLFDYLTKLSFSDNEIRIYLDLKLREREEAIKNVRIAAVDCCQEALHSMSEQISRISRVDVYEYLLDSIMGSSEPFRPDADIIVTTPTHFEQLSSKLAAGQSLTRVVMAISGETLLELARVPKRYAIGIVSASERFAGIITGVCNTYGVLSAPPRIACLGDADGVERLLLECDQVILPPNYLHFASKREQELIGEHIRNHPPIHYQYQIEKGSYIYLEEQAEKIYKHNSRQM